MRLPTYAAVAALAFTFSTTTSAATLLVDSGELTGATGVEILGAFYDVSFVEGTCAEVFSGCDQLADFTFVDSASAQAAAQALLDQVFVDTTDGQFDSDPTLTYGCSEVRVCRVPIPYSLIGEDGTGDVQIALNWRPNDIGGDIVLSVPGYNASFDTSSLADNVWARFTPAATPVPEPGTWAMILIGFGAIGFALRRRKPTARLIQSA